MINIFNTACSAWSDDIDHAWRAILPRIETKLDLREIHLIPLMTFCITAVHYFHLCRFRLSHPGEKPTYPSGLEMDLDFLINQTFSIARTAAGEFYLIPKSAVPFASFNEDGIDEDLIRLFNWEERIHG